MELPVIECSMESFMHKGVLISIDAIDAIDVHLCLCGAMHST